MGRLGCMGWLPRSVLDEAERIRMDKRLKKRAEALDELVKYARVGREAEKLASVFGVGRKG